MGAITLLSEFFLPLGGAVGGMEHDIQQEGFSMCLVHKCERVGDPHPCNTA